MNESNGGARKPLPTSINYHLWEPCNMRCAYCFAQFKDVRSSVLPRGHLPREDALELTGRLARSCKKLTFVGGEPTLCPWLPELVRRAKDAGTVTMLVTNGSRLAIDRLADCLDWLTLSIDSTSAETHVALGRSLGERPIPIERYVELAERARETGMRLKVNTVVTALNADDDLRPLIERIRPERWKIFRALPVRGQNDGTIEAILPTDEQFRAFVGRQRSLPGVDIVAEDNEDMTGTYAMVDPAGRFFDNVDGSYRYGPPILEVGVEAAWDEVRFDRARFIERGGLYQFHSSSDRRRRP